MTDAAVVPDIADPAVGPADTRRAPLRDLWPYLRPHLRALAVVVAISLVGAALFLAQPALVAEIIDRVSSGRPLWTVVALLTGLLLGGAVVSGLQQYLLQRAAESIVRQTRRTMIERLRIRITAPSAFCTAV